MADSNTTVHGDIEVTENRHRRQAFVRVSKIAAVIEVCGGGPSTLIFTNGGELEICGDAQYWRRCIAIAELECIKS